VRLLDTNHCSLILDHDTRVLARLADHSAEGFVTSIIVQGELQFMAYRSEHPEQNMARVSEFLSDLNVYALDDETTDCYAHLKSDLLDRFGPKEKAARRRFTLGQLGFTDNDLWIAATALQHDLNLVSADSDFSRIAEVRPLRFESWI
jgi:tRNA(fMet)-specific endonuclease VapC